MSRGKRAFLALFFACDGVVAAGLIVLIVSGGLPGWPTSARLPASESPAPGIARPSPGTPLAQAHQPTDPPAVGSGASTGARQAPPFATGVPTARASATPGSTPAVTEAKPAQAGGRTAPPQSAYITRVAGHAQSLALSCESRSASDWAAAFGFHVDELEFLMALPSSDDPDRGFVGDVHGDWGQVPPNAYGVHAGPVARLLIQYSVPAYLQLFMRFETLQSEVAAGRPVIVWVTGHVEPGTGRQFIAADGHHTVVAPFEHTVIVVGYDSTTVTIVDGARRYAKPIEQFMASWQSLRYMAITASP